MLSRYLQQANCQVYYLTADADLLIVDEAVGSSRTMDTLLDGDDTDLLILLCYHAELNILDLFFPTRIKSKFQASILEYKISEEKAWPRDLSSHSFFHAIRLSGCDPTSGLYGICKDLPLKRFVSDTHFREHVKVFDSLPACWSLQWEARRRTCLMYYDFVAFVKRCLLVPPRFSLKAAAASYDSIRVYHQQLIQWKSEDEQIPAEEWGWKCTVLYSKI